MKFRTPVEIEVSKDIRLSHSTPLLLIGSCFSDNIASRLIRDGFEPIANPGGALYNPASIAGIMRRALHGDYFKESELVNGPRGYHLPALSTTFSGPDPAKIIADANRVLKLVGDILRPEGVCFITLGTAFVFERIETGEIVGNCHKLPGYLFNRRRLSVEECTAFLRPVVEELAARGVNCVLTVSPVRHTADTLHGNTLSKATLHLACDKLCEEFSDTVSYFPAFEAIIDDLRDYRFTAPDMKHPTEQAADYVYDLFRQCYFSEETERIATEARKNHAREAHRPILEN
ncbi:MAG: GSCFA domain-containing protein [Muribaculaceae bacterium]|nr:GSCFA domain-containing protein [Muribaculaceae bacterium]